MNSERRVASFGPSCAAIRGRYTRHRDCTDAANTWRNLASAFTSAVNFSAAESRVPESGAPFVRDEKIGEFDERSEDLLARINGAGSGAQSASSADCKVLEELRGNMAALVDAQTSKWAYMFAKIDAELAK